MSVGDVFREFLYLSLFLILDNFVSHAFPVPNHAGNFCACVLERESDTEKDRDAETDTETQKDIQRDKDRDIETETHTERDTETQRET